MVRMPLTAASPAALLASGERTELAGSDFGSEAMFMPYFMRVLAAVQPERGPALVCPVRRMVIGSEIAETG